ncbi:hypothetical protein D3C80_1644880 [compost metagenome]
MTTFGDHLNFFTRAINRVTRYRNAGSGFQCNISHDLLTAADAAQNTARMIALETLRGDFIAILAAAQRNDLKTVANLHAFHGVNAHHRVRDISIQTVKHRFA